MNYFHFLIFTTTVLPILVYLVYIYIRDQYKKEPIPMLLLSVFMGIMAATITIFLDYPEMEALELPAFYDWWECVNKAFRVYAIPSEVTKFVALTLFLMFNKYYDEYIDAIVYSVCIALAFVGLKNGWFLYYNEDGQLYRGILTALVLIPAHFTIGTVMGYFIGLARLNHRKYYYLIALFASILVDGMFCSLFLWIDDKMSYKIIAIIALTILGLVMHGLTHYVGITRLLDEDVRHGVRNSE